MSMLNSGQKGTLPVGVGSPAAPAFGTVPPGPDNNVLLTDSTQPNGIKWNPTAPVDPRDVFRFSMLHSIGVGGGNG